MWAVDKRHGQGTYWKNEGTKLRREYTGDWYEDKKHGRGTFFYKNALLLLDDFLNRRGHERVHVVVPLLVFLLAFLALFKSLDSFAIFCEVFFGDDGGVILGAVVFI